MKYLVSWTCLLSTCIASAVELNYKLIKSEYPTPAQVITTKDYPNSCTLITGSVGNLTNCNAWTQIAWARCVSNQYDRLNASSSSTYGSWFSRPWAIQFFSTRRGISSSEGGSDLQPVPKCDWDYDKPLTLDEDGQWAMIDLLPACKDYDNGGLTNDVSWSYGCYAINITTDSDLTLTVGGYEKYVEAAAGKQVFNIKCETTDRSVTIAAAETNAVIKFGLAENPLVEFHGDQIDMMSNGGGSTFKDETEGFCGFGTNEWVMIVSRARVNDDKSLTYQFGCMYSDCDHLGTKKTKVPNWKTEGPYFGPYSRIAVQCAAMSGMTNKSMSVYHHRIFKGWLDDERLSLIRDQDVREMQNIGIWAKRQSGFGWDFSINTTNSYQDTSTYRDVVIDEYTEPGTLNKGDIYQRVYPDPVYIIEITLTSAEYTMDQITWSCPGSTNFVNGKFYVPSGDTYQVSGLDPEGNTLTCSISTKRSSFYTQKYYTQFKSYGNTKQARWQQYLNKRVTDTLDGLTYAGIGSTYDYAYHGSHQFKKWRFKRCPVSPYKAGNTVGWARPHAVSPHVWANAAHYGGLAAQGNPVLTYRSEDGTKTSVVRVDTSTRTNLYTWAQVNMEKYGWTTNDIAAVSDTVVGTYFQDTGTYSNFVDSAMCPYFVNPDEFGPWWGCTNGSTVMAWAEEQHLVSYTDNGWLFPVLVYTPFTTYDVRYGGQTNTLGNVFNTWTQPRTLFEVVDWDGSAITNTATNARFPMHFDRSNIVTDKNAAYSMQNLIDPNVIAKFAAKREELLSTSRPEWEFPEYYVGDSGLGGYINPEDGVWLLNIHNTSVGGGPNYHRMWKILKAYCEQFGDELKMYTFPDEPPSE